MKNIFLRWGDEVIFLLFRQASHRGEYIFRSNSATIFRIGHLHQFGRY